MKQSMVMRKPRKVPDGIRPQVEAWKRFVTENPFTAIAQFADYMGYPGIQGARNTLTRWRKLYGETEVPKVPT
jgi:hypothetical protein